MSEGGNHIGGQSVGEEMRALYTELALHPEKDFGWGKGKDNARGLGYDRLWLERLPEAVWESSAAVGNPFAIGPIRPGETVVDLGCGAGADVCVAAMLVGPTGHVIGVDVTRAMVEKARANVALMGLGNVEILEADIAGSSVSSACADVVISNGAIHLSQRKACVLKEALRVLKPGGRLYVADMVRETAASTTEARTESAGASWANCIAGTLGLACFGQLIAESGFVDLEFLRTTGYRTAPETVGALFRARRPG